MHCECAKLDFWPEASHLVQYLVGAVVTLLYSYAALTANFLDGTSFYIMYTEGTKL